ncbi:MAG: TonB-dependent siderophore receptor, partial [Oxalicibacterium faecigallinarum]|uniref:TonB-dependent siderophore receptor n=1 Tax=Oxalicibacterium faecigallinarum TaxID=573741 RepID=UPI002806D5B5
EVLRGAAGHTVGAGDPGGTINQVRKRPTSEFAGSVGLTMGRWNSRRLELDLGGPLALNGHLRGRMVAVKQEADSFRDWYTSDKEVFYGILEADLGPRTMVSLGYDYQKPENSGVTWGTIPYWLSNGSLANMPRSFNPAARWSQWNVQQQQAFARVDHRFNDEWKLRVTYTQDEQKSYGSRWFGGAGYFPNPDGTGKSAWYGGGDNYGTATSWDVDLNGRFDLFGRSHSVNVGYHTEEAKNNTPAGVDVYPADFFSVIPDWRNWDGNVPQYVRNYLGYDSSYSIGKQSALYAAANLQLADSLKAVVGARYGDWEKYSWTYSPSTGGYTRSGYAIDNVVTPYASLLYDVSKNFTVYGSYTDIFTPQGYRNFNGDYLDPVNGKHFELGLKGEFFDGALNTNIAIFRSKKDNVAEIDDTGSLPAGSFDPANPPAGYNNAGYRVIPGTEEVAYRATGKGNQMEGYEFEVQGALSRNWNLAGGYTHISMKDKNGLAIQTYLPRNTLRLRTSYRLPGDWSKLALGGGITWQSETWANVNGVPTGQPGVTETRRITQSAFYLLNFSAQYQMSKQLSFNFNINNLLDKTYYSRVGFYSGVMYGTPRDVRLNMRYTF